MTTPDGTGFLLVATATEDPASAERLAGLAVQARLAAGAQIAGPVTSVFWHLGEFGTGTEYSLILFTHADRYDELESFLLEHHPWEKPQITATEIVAGSADYLSWVGRSVGLDQDASP